MDGAGGLLDGLQEPEHLLPAAAAPLQELPARGGAHGRERRPRGAEPGGGVLGERAERAARGLEPREVPGGEAAGGQDLPDKVAGQLLHRKACGAFSLIAMDTPLLLRSPPPRDEVLAVLAMDDDPPPSKMPVMTG